MVSWFISRLRERVAPLYKILKETIKFFWTKEADATLQSFKDILSNPPILDAPKPQEPMLLYITATNRIISIVTLVECKEENHEYLLQHPTYYLSELLTESRQ